MILLADDNDITVEMWGNHFRSWGYAFDTAINGEDAVAKVKKNDFSLVIMDILLPGMNGIAAAQAIRALPLPKCNVPMIALTGGMASATMADIHAARFDLIVQKPVLPSQLKAAIDSYARPRP
jgi:CheY-like chemotaxis protein